MRFLTAAALVLIFLGGGCRSRSRDEVPIIPVSEDDQQMKAAMDKARSSVGTFIAALKSPKPSQSGFAIKKQFSDGKHVEHIWLWPVTHDGEQFQGVVNNKPAGVTGVVLGQKVSVEPNQISDWMYLENQKFMGGYTIRAIREKMSSEERKEFDRSAGFVID